MTATPPTSRYVTLTVYSAELTPAMLTARLGITPDETREKGSRSTRHPTVRPAAKHRWELEERGDYTDWTLDLVHRLRLRLAPAEQELRHLVEAGTVSVQLGVYLYVSREEVGDEEDLPDGFVGPGFPLEPELIAWLAALRASVDLDIY